MDNILETTQIEIPKKSNIRVIWEDDSENYTQERVKRINKYISEKYGNNNVQVIFKPKNWRYYELRQ